MTLTEIVIYLSITLSLIGLSYPSIQPITKVIDSQTKIIHTLQEISKNRQKSIDNGGEPVKMGDVTYWPTRCTPHKFTCGNKMVILNDYYRIKVIKNETKKNKG